MTPTLISAFLTYTLITALTPGPNNILALSSVTSHGLRRSLRVLAGMSVGFIITMLICAALTFSLVELDSRFTLVLGWIGAAYILWLAWQIAKSKPATGTPSVEPVGFWASLGLQFVNVKIILYGKSVLGAGGASVSAPVFAVRAATELDAGSVIGLLCCADRGGIKRERSGSRRVISRS